jgi:hypothetical protein
LNIYENSILLDRYKEGCSWIASYGAVAALCKEISAKRVCEIGVAYGYHAESLLTELELEFYLGVDPYVPHYDPEDSFAADVDRVFEHSPGSPMDNLYQTVLHRLASLGNGMANLCRMRSEDAAAIFADDTFDLIYIDGDHRATSVYRDIRAWLPKVRGGGILCGDDVRWPGTESMLAEVSREIRKEIKVLTWKGVHEKWFFRV